MTTLKGQEELDQYKLTKREVADFLGISTNAVRMSMRGKNCHKLEFRFDGAKYLFKVPQRDQVQSRLVDHSSDLPRTPKTPLGRHKKIYNRGATARGEANYPNLAFQMANEAKMRVALDKKFKNEAHKKAFMDMSEAGFKEAYEISKRAKLKVSQENSRVSTPEVFPGGRASSINQQHGKYGGILTAPGIAEVERKALQREDRKYEEETGTKYKQEWQTQERFDGTKVKVRVNTREIDFRPRNSSYFIGKAPYDTNTGEPDDPGSVEFSQSHLDNYGPIQERTSFNDKIEESIYRTKKHLLKTKGGWD